MSHVISIDVSPKQLSKLRNGHPVRIKQGTGFNVVVHPGTYNLVNKAFSKSKGVQVKLSPEELQMNRSLSPEQHAAMREQGMTGQGIFSKGLLKDMAKKALKEVVKTQAPGLIKMGLQKGVDKLTENRSDLVKSIAKAGASSLGDLASSAIEKKMSGGMMVSGIVAKPARTLKQKLSDVIHDEALNEKLGTNFGYMGKAGMDGAMRAMASAKMATDAINARRGESKKYGQVVGGQIVRNHTHPALASQATDANFLMYNMLPPQFQTLKGKGLYAGGGLYAGASRAM